MGAFFTNYHVRTDSSSAVRQALLGLVRARAYVSPPKNGWITIYDEASDEQDSAILKRMAGGISKALGTAVLALLVHDSDIAAYWLYQNGTLVDEFDSNPDYYKRVKDAERARLRGNPDALLPLCAPGTTLAQIDSILHDPDGPPIIAEQIFTELAPLLGIDEARITLGFTYFEEEGPEVLPDIGEFEPLGRGAEKKESKAPDPGLCREGPQIDTYPVAVGMLVQSWGAHKIMGPAFAAMITGAGRDEMMKKLRTGMDRQARELLKHSKLEGRPTFEELKAARDNGPQALAALLASHPSAYMGDIGVQAVVAEAEEFVAALIAHGLDPNALGNSGQTPLSAAERRGKNTKIYRLLKEAADR